MNSTKQPGRLILNGKSAQLPEVREAVFALRERGAELEVRVTWEQGDARRFAEQAGQDGVARLIVGGGDGTVHEAVNGLMGLPEGRRPALGIMPLGSANDLACGLALPLEPEAALQVALDAMPRAVDVPRLGDIHYLNMATGGFGADVSSSTPEPLKRLLGGGAYPLMGVLKAWRYEAYAGRLHWTEGEREQSFFLLAIGNGVQSGGGQHLTPAARLDDGLLDVLVVRDFENLAGMKQMLDEIERLPESGEFVEYFRTDRLSYEGAAALPLTLDGEVYRQACFEVTLAPGALRLLVPEDCPLLGGEQPQRVD